MRKEACRSFRSVKVLIDLVAGLLVTYYCCVKQGIRLIDKTNGKQLEINLSSIISVLVRIRAA